MKIRKAELSYKNLGTKEKCPNFMGWQYSGRKKITEITVSELVIARCPDFKGGKVNKRGMRCSKRCPVYQGVLISGVS